MKKRMKFISAVVLSSMFILVACEKANLFTDEMIDVQEATAHVITYSSNVIPGSYIVVYKDDFINQEMSGRAIADTYEDLVTAVRDVTEIVLKDNNVEKEKITQAYGKAVRGFAANLTEEQVVSLQRDDRIAYLEQDQTVSVTMGGPPGGGGGGDTGQSVPWGITRVGGPVNYSGSGRAWIIDSGIDLDHPDLNVDVANSETFLGGNSTPDDQNGHGTHVAGTVAAVDNSIGVIGVAAGAPVVAVRVLDRRGSGSTSGVIAGVDYVAGKAGSNDAANMSLGGGVSTTLDNAVIAAANSCPFALAAGNESDNALNHSPARAGLNNNKVHTVSAMNSSDNFASFSNYGSPVDYCAPGVGVNSLDKNGGYGNGWNGTSMASPHVCGILLLGSISTDGTVNNDPDGNPDPIAVHN